MRIGVCRGVGSLADIELAGKLGYDYIETGFFGLSDCSDEEYDAFVEALGKAGLKCEFANGFLPRTFRVTMREYNIEEVRAYIEKGMSRGAKVGLKTVVFGSSKARAVPEDMSFAEGYLRLIKFLNEVALPIGEKYGITVVIEPLRKDESNIIHTVKEGVMLAASADKKNVGGLADLYHMVGSGDTYEDIRTLKGCILHSHISNPIAIGDRKRCYPASADEYDYKGFFDALAFAGCETCSIEANCKDFTAEAPVSLKLLKSL